MKQQYDSLKINVILMTDNVLTGSGELDALFSKDGTVEDTIWTGSGF